VLSKNVEIKIPKPTILPVVLYGCETWSQTLREEHRQRMLRGISGLWKDEVIGGERKLHNEELRDLYSWPSIIRTMKSRRISWAGLVARMGKTNTYMLFAGTLERRPLGRRRRRWVDNIKMDLREIEWGCVDQIGLLHDRNKWRGLVNSVMNLRAL
jgi:hypothetical protein